MAILLNDATPDFLNIDAAVATSFPFGMAAWVRTDSISLTQRVICLANSASSTGQLHVSLAGGDVGDPVRAVSFPNSGSTATANTTAGYSANTWHHVAAAFFDLGSGNYSVSVWLDGGNKGTSGSVSQSPGIATNNRTSFGRENDATPGSSLSGEGAEWAIWGLIDWGADNTEREANFSAAVAAMAKLRSPEFYPAGRLLYRNLIREINSPGDIWTVTASGSPAVSDHPPIIYPAGPIILGVPAAAEDPPDEEALDDRGKFARSLIQPFTRPLIRPLSAA